MLKKLGKYEILGVLGRGSMGVVYKGMDPDIGKLVAIKTMNQKVLKQEEMKERFYREGTILGQLHHKNIISVYNVGEDGEHCYIAMEYLEGTTLDRVVQMKGKLPLERIMHIMKQVCEGVHAAHRQAIIHRDLKPANIFLLEDDHVKVLDFGVAHFGNSQLTNSGMLLGTINYIAPEQITGLKVDYRADIFSIGVVLYELLAEKNPFLGKNISQTMVKIVNETPPPIEDAPKKLTELLEKALHKDRNRRYISTKLMASDIDRVLRDAATGGGKPARSASSLSASTASSLTAAATSSTVGAGGMAGARKTQNDILKKMINERIDNIKNHLRREELDQADSLLGQLKRLDKANPSIPDLESRLDKARKRGRDKKNFVNQLTHDTLVKANEKMNERHYVAAIEFCEKVLKVDADNQDAKVIKANAIRKMEHFLSRAKSGTL